MAKAMVFIDGSWFYRKRDVLFAKLGEADGFEIDYAQLPKLLCEKVADRLDEDVSLVRTCYFGTVPSGRGGSFAKQRAFYDFLERTCGYETEVHAVESGEGDCWVQVSLAAALVYFAAQPGAFDVAIVVSDNPDLSSAVRRARLFGKRVQVVGMHDDRYNTLFNKSRVNDFKPLYLDDFAAEMRLVREVVKRTCSLCGREEETTWAGHDFYCSQCRRERTQA